MNWRIAAAAVVAFVVGAVVGGFIEHDRVQNDKTDASATGSTSTTAATPAAVWFGSQQASACPALTRWYAAIGKASYAAARKGPWPPTRSALVQQASAVGAAYKALLPLANAAGKSELEFLIAYEDRLTAALQTSASAPAYAKSELKLGSKRLDKDVAIVVSTANRCPKR